MHQAGLVLLQLDIAILMLMSFKLPRECLRSANRHLVYVNVYRSMARSLNVETFTFEVESKAVGCHALFTFALFYNIAGERHVIIIRHKAKGAYLGYDMLPSK